MENNFHIQIIDLINSNIDHVKKYKTERFKNRWIIDVFLNTSILNISVGSKILVNVNNSINQHVLDFYRNEKVFTEFSDFKYFFNSIIKGYVEKSKGIHVTFRGEEYLCDIEVISVDTERNMGTETLYKISFIDNQGNQVNVADISEYPMGDFSIYKTNKNVILNKSSILDYFLRQAKE